MIVYVHDIILHVTLRAEEISRRKEILAREFEVKDLGRLTYFLGIEVARSRKGFFITQKKYTIHLLIVLVFIRLLEIA